jgi:hypothetical protein
MQNTHKNNPHAGFTTTKRLLGKILVEGEFISPKNLEVAVEQQKKTNDQLGETLVRMGLLDPLELKAVLSIQRDLSSSDDAVKIAAGVRLLLGELLLKAKRLTPAQLDYALREQQRTGEKLGEVLVRHGLLIDYELSAVLAFQERQRAETALSVKLRLGEILVTTGQISRDQLEDVLKQQKLSKKKIGDVLVEAGYVQAHQIDHGLKIQQKLLTAALVAALSLASIAGAGKAYAGSASGPETSSKVNVSAVVREHTTMTILSQAPEMVVTNADIMRGYVDIPAATRIIVKSNNPAGYLLSFEVMGDPSSIVNSVNVIVGGREVRLSPGGGWMPQPYVRGGATLDVHYRFVLVKDAQPGTYHWPLMVSVLPI